MVELKVKDIIERKKLLIKDLKRISSRTLLKKKKISCTPSTE